MIKVRLVIPTMDRGGAEKQLCLLANGLPKDHFDVRVTLLTRDGPRSQELHDGGIPVDIIGKAFKCDPRSIWRLRQSFMRDKPDIVHTWIFAANAIGRVAALSAGIKTIVASERCVDPWKSAWQWTVDRQLATRTRIITTNSPGVVEFYQNHGIAPEKFRVIPNGVPQGDRPMGNRPAGSDPASSGPADNLRAVDRATVLSRFGLDPDRRLLLAVGRLWPQKNYRDMIWAAELLEALRGDTTLAIVGDGPQRGELMRHRDAVTSAKAVRFLGMRNDVAELMPHADLLWNDSLYEGQSNSILEAMTNGIPVIASDIPGNRDLVQDGATGFLVPPGESATRAKRTRQLLDDDSRRLAMGNAAAARVADHFTVDQMVQRHADLYRELVQ